MRLEVLTELIIKILFLGANRQCSLAHKFKCWGGIHSITLKTEVAGFFKTSIHVYQTTWRYIPEQCHLHFHIHCDFTHCICVVNIYY
jgi:hypothetical protein